MLIWHSIYCYKSFQQQTEILLYVRLYFWLFYCPFLNKTVNIAIKIIVFLLIIITHCDHHCRYVSFLIYLQVFCVNISSSVPSRIWMYRHTKDLRPVRKWSDYLWGTSELTHWWRKLCAHKRNEYKSVGEIRVYSRRRVAVPVASTEVHPPAPLG